MIFIVDKVDQYDQIDEPKAGDILIIKNGKAYNTAWHKIKTARWFHPLNKYYVALEDMKYGDAIETVDNDSVKKVHSSVITLPEGLSIDVDKIKSITDADGNVTAVCLEHKWVTYKGLFEEFEYCSECDKRKT